MNNFQNIIIALGLAIAGIVLALATGGTLLPISIPMTAYALKLLGVPME